MEFEMARLSGRRRRPWLIALALWLGLAAVTSFALWQLRRDAVESQSRELDLLSLTLTDGIDRGLRGAEEGLQALRAELQAGQLALSGDRARQTLSARTSLMPLVRSLWLMDSTGRVFAASDETIAPHLVALHPAPHRQGDGTVSLGASFNNAGADGPLVSMAIPFALRRAPPGASEGSGWILAAIPTHALLGAFGAAVPPGDIRARVLHADGARLVGVNGPDVKLDDATLVRRLSSRPSIELRRSRDGSDHLTALHAIPRYGVQVVVSRDLVSVLRSWTQAAEVAGAVLALLLVSMAVTVYFLLLADRRRADAQRALQAQASRTSRLESLGTLAGSVAHDFNNILAGIVGYGEMAQDVAPQGSDQARHLDKVLQAALRGKALVDRILAFSRGGARVSAVFELEPVVDEVLTLLSASLPANTLLQRALHAPGVRLRGDATQIFEVVMNLCTNALQAMPRGGTLRVHVARQAVAAPRVLSHARLAAGDYVTVTVSDEGTGITPDVMEHLFEPFFTTRSAQSGTGLGLAVVFGVVAESGGAVDVQSSPGEGARFSVYFPECRDPLNGAEAGPLTGESGSGQRLLVVDDEHALVELAIEMLAGLGYEAVGYTDPRLALQALEKDPAGFVAVITDEVMPGLTGTQLTLALRQHAPTLPVLLISGFGGALLAQRASEAGVSRVLTKPLRRMELARALGDLLS